MVHKTSTCLQRGAQQAKTGATELKLPDYYEPEATPLTHAWEEGQKMGMGKQRVLTRGSVRIKLFIL